MIAKNDSIYSQNLLWMCLFELCLNLVFISPGTQGYFKIKGSVYKIYNYDKLFNSSIINSNPNISPEIQSRSKEGQNLNWNKAVLEDLYYDYSVVISLVILLRFYHLIRMIYNSSIWSK